MGQEALGGGVRLPPSPLSPLLLHHVPRLEVALGMVGRVVASLVVVNQVVVAAVLVDLHPSLALCGEENGFQRYYQTNALSFQITRGEGTICWQTIPQP